VSRYDTNPDPDRHQNLIICSLAIANLQKFLRKVANRQTDNKQRRLHILLAEVINEHDDDDENENQQEPCAG